MNHFLFTHFTGEHENGEQVYFSISQDGQNFIDLKEGNPILTSKIGTKGARDPFLIRDEINKKFYLIATDLNINQGLGWEVAQESGSVNIVVWESTDLVYWSEPRLLPIPLEEAGNVWAPEAIYDENEGAFLVFWASKIKEKHRIYAAYTKDFLEFSQPFIFVEKENDVIDTTVIEREGIFYRFTKDETTKRIIMEKSATLVGSYEEVSSPTLASIKGVEGPQIYQVAENKWYLILDHFSAGTGYAIYVTEDLGNQDFVKMETEEYDFGLNLKRHGSVLPITEEEYQRLQKYYQQSNPVIDGLWADPDLVKFGEDYYIYPTTDGFKGWSGTAFSVFKSKDLRHFEHQNVIIDLTTDQVPWAKGNAWAPCIAEKNGRYYYYFCGKREDGRSCIGVAVSDSPTGPFISSDEPLLPAELIEEKGLKMAQMIDPSIYQEDGRDFILFGNGGTGAIVELNEDMVSFKEKTVVTYEGLVDFREAIEVFKRDGLYHFTWSCDDTGSENYHVNYGVSKSLFGPVEYLYPVLEKDPERGILGTGHHSIFKEPGKDSYVIAYHRFGTPLEKYPEGEKGYYRETCISPVDFDVDGFMRKIII